MAFETDQIILPDGEIKGGDNYKILNFGVDATYTSPSSYPSWAILAFRVNVSQLADYFKVGTEVWGKLVLTGYTGAGIARHILEAETSGAELGLVNLDTESILWQSGNTIRYTFNGTPDLSSITVGEYMLCNDSTNASNNGHFEITAVDDGSDWIEVTNAGRSDATDDEASASPCVADTGSVTQILTTDTASETVVGKPFKITENEFYRLKSNKTSGSGARIAAASLILFTK